MFLRHNRLLMDFLWELYQQLRQYLDPRTIAAAGYAVLILVIFAETGLAAGFFFPGDSLLVVAGLYAANGSLNVYILLSTLFVAAVVGDAVGYYTGAKFGPKIF
ncbi:MAG: DedA family protein, partial [Chloroflexota bacterium]